MRLHRHAAPTGTPTALATLLAVVATVVVAASPATAAECPPPAGEHQPFQKVIDIDGDVKPGELDPDRLDGDHPDAYDVVVNGGGWGHGIGMSQYGARGAALLGCNHAQILGTYFPGTAVDTVETSGTIRVGLFPYAPTGQPGGGYVEVINVKNDGPGALEWTVSGTDETVTQPAGEQWTVRVLADGGFQLTKPGGDKWPPGGSIGGQDTRLQASLSGTRVHLPSKGRDYKRGTLEFTSRGAEAMSVVVVVPTMNEYLYGLAEVPSSWPAETLKAQAIAGRSFAMVSPTKDNCLCDVYDSVYSQAYYGAAKEEEPGYGDDWVAAVEATTNRVVTHDGAVVRVFYSSSNGGISSAAWDIWGSDPAAFPYLPAVDTSRWEQAAGVDNPRHRWSFGFTDEQLAAAFGLDEFKGIEVIERAPGGRPCLATAPAAASPCQPRDLDGDGDTDTTHGTLVRGVVDGTTVYQTFSAEQIRSKLGVFSGLIAIDGQAPPFGPSPVTAHRRAGENRIVTAVELSRTAWKSSPVALLARADDPSDALAGSGLAGSLDAPLLLTTGNDLQPVVKDELARLGTSEVILLGGEAALGPRVAQGLRDAGIEVSRVFGSDRFGTAAEIARRLAPAAGGDVLLVRGAFAGHPERIWPDAMAVSGLAARKAKQLTPWPILPIAESIPDTTREVLAELQPATVHLVGGTAVIPQAVEDDLAVNHEVARHGGKDRYGTSRLVAALDAPEDQRVVLATGQDFPDGLASGPFAARIGGVLLLVPRDHNAGVTPWLSSQHPKFLEGLAWDRARVYVAGGTAAVDSPVVDHVVNILRQVAARQPSG